MSEGNDDAWLDALAGRRVAEASRDEREGWLLRDALRRALPATSEPADADADAAAEVRVRRELELVARARREGLLPPPDAPRERRRGFRAVLLAAALGGVAIALTWQLPPGAPDVALRSQPGTPVRLESADPVALQREIVAALRAAGVTARAYEQLGVYGIDADLPSPTTPELRRVLQSRGIALPADGVLQIEIRAPR